MIVMRASSSYNSTKLNHDKCHMSVSGYKHENAQAPIGDEIILALKGLKKEEF